MARINADGSKLIECGEDIIFLCSKYDETIEHLFSKLSKIPSYAWSGNSANEYVQKIMKDRTTYLNFGNNLRIYGKVIKNTGKNINYIIEKWDGK